MSIWTGLTNYNRLLITKRDYSVAEWQFFWNEDTGTDDVVSMKEYGWGLIAPATLSKWED